MEDYVKDLWKQLEQGNNKQCADCGVSLHSSIWANINFGIFICEHCAGVHRNLSTQNAGSDVWRIKSLTLDNWTEAEANLMIGGGNDAMNKTLLRFIDNDIEPIDPESSMAHRRSWIGRKYCKKEFLSEKQSNKMEKKQSFVKVQRLPNRLIDKVVVLGLSDHCNSVSKDYNDLGLEVFAGVEVLDHYPVESEVPLMLDAFAYSRGKVPLSPSFQEPTIFTFLLTDTHGLRSYCTCLQFSEQVTSKFLLKKIRETHIGLEDVQFFARKSLILTSHHALWEVQEFFLKQLYRLSISHCPVPLERYIANICCEIPLPPRGRVAVTCSLGDQDIQIERPPVNRHPGSRIDMSVLFYLSVTNVVQVLRLLLLEQRVLVVSRSKRLLTPFAEAMCTAMFPFQWSGLLIPILPVKALDVVSAPVPYLIGMTASHWRDFESQAAGQDVNIVFLDEDRIQLSNARLTSEPLPELPEKPKHKLIKALSQEGVFPSRPFEVDSMIDDAFHHLAPITSFAVVDGIHRKSSIDSPFKPNEIILAGFQRFFASVLLHYNECILVNSSSKKRKSKKIDEVEEMMSGREGLEELFDHSAFVLSFHSSARPFVLELGRTQMFYNFLRDRFQVDTPDASVRYFEDVVAQKRNRNFSSKIGRRRERSTSFLDRTDFMVTDTYQAPLPRTNDALSEFGYDYTSFPRFSYQKFGIPTAPKVLCNRAELEMSQTSLTNRDTHKDTWHRIAGHSDYHRVENVSISDIEMESQGSRRHSMKLKRPTSEVKLIDTPTGEQIPSEPIVEEYSIQQLLRSSVKLQAWWRVISQQKKYNQLKTAVIQLQYRWRKAVEVKKKKTIVFSIILMFVARYRFRKKKRAIIKIGAEWRRFAQRRLFLKQKMVTIKLQSWWRGMMVLKRESAKRKVAYALQSVWRAGSIRQHHGEWLKSRMEWCRRELVKVWEQRGVSLWHRTAFWLRTRRVSALNAALHHDELKLVRSPIRGAMVACIGSKGVSHERKDIYDLLSKYLSDDQREDIFKLMNISQAGKRKRKVSRLLFGDISLDSVDKSAAILHLLVSFAIQTNSDNNNINNCGNDNIGGRVRTMINSDSFLSNKTIHLKPNFMARLVMSLPNLGFLPFGTSTVNGLSEVTLGGNDPFPSFLAHRFPESANNLTISHFTDMSSKQEQDSNPTSPRRSLRRQSSTLTKQHRLFWARSAIEPNVTKRRMSHVPVPLAPMKPLCGMTAVHSIWEDIDFERMYWKRVGSNSCDFSLCILSVDI
eukprot:TRINITY_DN9336_c0_g2_i1.p1 TRINITY_DN9336_c0_g2~~TRINITY_DN9336_c0_g2_i1.p1  ORF type:complete len:1256 (+),score=305.29 TRINITY_DN9336_c0_g2_i1:268-4035(+)